MKKSELMEWIRSYGKTSDTVEGVDLLEKIEKEIEGMLIEMNCLIEQQAEYEACSY